MARRTKLRDRRWRTVRPEDRQDELSFGPSGKHERALEAVAYWRRAASDPCFVYFIRAFDGGPVKIGTAVDPAGRLVELQCGNPEHLGIEYVLLGWRETELHLHRRFNDAQVRGEWFGRGYEDVILAFAAGMSEWQLAAHKDGIALDRIVAEPQHPMVWTAAA